MSSTSSQGLAGSASASSGPECEPSPSARSTPIADVSSPGTGLTFPATATSEPLLPNGSRQMELPWISSAAAFPASRSQVLREDAISATLASGRKCAGLFRNAGPVGSFVRTLLTSTDWQSDKWWLIWKGSDTRSRHRLKFRLVPSDTITGGHASGFVATPTAKANQAAPSMTKWAGCQNIIVEPEVWERRMGYPAGWTDLEV